MTTLRWYAARTQPRHEKAVLLHLRSRELEAFLPVYRSTKRWKNGIQANVDLPLFPGYIFVRTTLEKRVPVLSAPGVVGLVGSGVRPCSIPDQEIDLLANGISDYNPQPHAYVKLGDRFQIRNGSLAGREGVLVRKKQGFRFVISIDMLLRSVSLEVDARDLDHIPSTASGLAFGIDENEIQHLVGAETPQ